MTATAFSNAESPITYDLSDIPSSILNAEILRRKQRVGLVHLHDCEFCGQPFRRKDLRVHRPVCVKRPPPPITGVFRPCKYCGIELNARQMRAHVPHCDKYPMKIRRAQIRIEKAAKAAAAAAARKRAKRRP